MIKKFNDYILESIRSKYTNDYKEGDIVFINYWLTGDMTPVKLKEKKGGGFIVSHKVKNSNFFNAPDHFIKTKDIVGRYQGIDSAPNSVERRLDNPTFDPDVSQTIPNWNSFNSNDIAF